jgi:hypothetical protein
MTAIAASLTDKESALYEAIKKGMDSPGNGWLSQLTPFDNDHITAGVLGSLISKGLVDSNQDDEPVAGCLPDYWVSLA